MVEIRLLNDARRYHERGNAAAAEQSYKQLLAMNPKHSGGLYHYAIFAFQSGRGELALGLMERALSAGSASAELYSNYGEMLRAAGRLDEALAHLRKAARLAPDIADIWNNAAGVLFALGRLDEAERFAKRAIKLAPGAIFGYLALAEILWAKDDMAGVIEASGKALSIVPGCTQAIARRALAHIALGDAALGRSGLDQALNLEPQLKPARLAMVDLLLSEGDLIAAEHYLTPLMARALSEVEVAARLGALRSAQERYLDALPALECVTANEPGNVDARIQLGWAEASTGRLDSGLARLQAVADENHVRAYLLLAELQTMRGMAAAAQENFAKAVALAPDDTAALRGYADTLVSAGDFAGARAVLRQVLDLAPNDGYAYEALADMTRRADWDAAELERMEAVAEDEALAAPIRAAAWFGLARLADGAKDTETAFIHARRANELMRSVYPFDAGAHNALVDHIMEVFSDLGTFSPALGADEQRPVFIVGMPRSGTSLVEQILASHSQVSAAGEVTFFDDIRFASGDKFPQGCTALTPNDGQALRDKYLDTLSWAGLERRYVTDKLPPNFLYLGFIRVLFPRAKIIHCRRNAMDTGLSLFLQNFTSARGNAFTFALEDIGYYTLAYQRLMAHWRRVLEPPMFELDYEDLVRSPEPAIAGLLRYLALDWEDACVNFHQTRRAVLTASRVQVRQPLYSHAVARAQRYEAYLRPLKAVLDSATGTGNAR